eukprot:GFUD01014293.1.p1 GENE.GFUD01014293.1~~GFUD01014293.1.p1  ORF type:complete len:206 (+),score=29.31 GFUD01014293.1:52-669(+)
MSRPLSHHEQLREVRVAELREHFKLTFGHYPGSGNELKEGLKVSKKKEKDINSTEKNLVKSVATRRSDRIKLLEKTPDYVEKNIELIKKKVSVGSNSRTVETITVNKVISANSLKDISLFQCDDCGQRFVYKNSLQRHKNSKHTENLYECNICGSTFLRLDSVKRHKEVMHKEGSRVTYSCKLCNKTFDYKQNLVKHLKKFHHSD